MSDKAKINLRYNDRDLSQKETFRYANELQVVSRPVDMPNAIPTGSKYEKFLDAFKGVSGAVRDFIGMQQVMAKENELLGRLGLPKPKEFLNLGFGYNEGLSLSAGEASGAEMALEYSNELLKNNYFIDDPDAKGKRLKLFTDLSNKYLQNSSNTKFIEAASGHLFRAKLQGEANAMDKSMEKLEMEAANNTMRGIGAFYMQLGDSIDAYNGNIDHQAAREQINALYMIHGKSQGLSREKFNNMLLEVYEEYANEQVQANGASGVVKAAGVMDVLRTPDNAGVRLENLSDKNGKPIYRAKLNDINLRLHKVYGEIQEQARKAKEVEFTLNATRAISLFPKVNSQEELYDVLMGAVGEQQIDPKDVPTIISEYRSFKNYAGQPDKDVVGRFSQIIASGRTFSFSELDRLLANASPATRAEVFDINGRMHRTLAAEGRSIESHGVSMANAARAKELFELKKRDRFDAQLEKQLADKSKEQAKNIISGRALAPNTEDDLINEVVNFNKTFSVLNEDGTLDFPKPETLAKHIAQSFGDIEGDNGKISYGRLTSDPNRDPRVYSNTPVRAKLSELERVVKTYEDAMSKSKASRTEEPEDVDLKIFEE